MNEQDFGIELVYQSLLKHLKDCLHIKKLKVYESLSSTNDEAMRLFYEGEESGTIVVALEQHMGRGRLSRSWMMHRGDVACSLLLRKEHLPPSHISLLPLVIALAVHDALAELGINTMLKWPNDIVCEGNENKNLGYFLHYKKLGGILVESAFSKTTISGAIIGIGINVVSNAKLAQEVPYAAYSQQLAPNIGMLAIIEKLIEKLALEIDSFKGSFFADVITRYEQVSATIGQQVKVLQGEEEIKGKALGLNEEGALLVFDGKKTHAIYAGDVIAI
ncbi:MAG TPA: biotin--[acetyl-CoA-carboxylase] ligase [Myxococcota bacterium]|nr:biotin--[acetyl-CoA-carboxylase] ligase [Myxococcota bacterium]